MNQPEILHELANLNPPQAKFDTSSMLQALELLQHPEKTYPVIHIAGSNGKGSTAAFLEAGLLAANYSVGKFTSPYIQRLNECIVLNQYQISDDELCQIYLEIKPLLLSHAIYVSSFEMLTLIMFVYFARHKVDYLILEAGLGGLNDATNVVASNYSIITNISLEHTQWLGTNLSAIATQKAGIIKSGLTIIATDTPELIAAVSHKTTNFINVLDKYPYQSQLNLNNFTTQVKFTDSIKSHLVTLGLFGHFQAKNFLSAYAVLHDLGLADELIFQAAATTTWSGRLECISHKPWIIADASHNVDGASQLYNTVRELENPSNCVIIASILADKNVQAMLDYYAKIADHLIVCNLPQQPRAINAIRLAKLAKHKFKNIHIYNSPLAALAAAKRLNKHLIVISGSTYLLKYFINPT